MADEQTAQLMKVSVFFGEAVVREA